MNKDADDLHVLYELSRLVAHSAYSDIDISGLLKTICEMLQATRGMIVLFSSDSGDMHTEAAYGLSDEEQKRGHYAFGEGVTGQVVKFGQAMFIADISKEPLFLNRTGARDIAKEAIAFLCVPLKSDGRILGALSLDFQQKKIKNKDIVVEVLGIISAMISPLVNLLQERLLIQRKEPDIAKKVRKFHHAGLVGTSETMQHIYRRIEQVANSHTTVLLRGESGTGKELVARALHDASGRKEEAFVAVNCGALPESLIESELFGHEKGAFTGAVNMRKGRFELAHNGTLFLDEVGELSLLTQARLLRVLQEQSFERVGGAKSIQVSVRIIAATNRDLEEMVAIGSFRRDLYYRLNVFSILLPSLRQRQSDILLLANHFLNKYAKQNGKFAPKIALSTMDMLHRYAWPGNIRELENIMERGILLIEQGEYLLPHHLPPELHSQACPFCDFKLEIPHDSGDISLPKRIEELERALINEALSASNGHINIAAKELGLSERILSLRLNKYQIDYKEFRK